MPGSSRATVVIAAATVLVSALLILTGMLSQAAIGAGFIPLRVGGAVLPSGLAVAVPLWLTPLTATLIHGGWAHLAFNLLMFVFCGRETERAVGAGGIAVLYIVGAYAAAAMQWVFSPASALPMIGASGAISAVVGAYAVLFGKRRTKRMGPVPAHIIHIVWLAAAWIGIQLLIGFAGMGGVTVAIGAHIGGFVAGLVLARPLLGWRYRRA
ncbi:rhomboid family intramembrane serine protease [Sphingomonas sp. CFBP 8760]|uniref:rhomboid family intramembrane serine protease n=1 Tax=Sphingomonas sp. CFBP 8760 TaxID=2775282 RepID=UPI0017860283|nr:rhomboid family intramembrane serine protease [Sphingomonas sp. CFBP 8760]MBD8548743.1 rhomboid family intramembrane serine protease [Sphingomonas sp. CFBP 8760]